MNKIRFYEIDLLRFLAALSVMLFHYTFRGYAADNMSPLSFPHLGAVFKYGSLGVDLFFIISGFVILLTAYNRTATNFVISRMTRMYPAYWFGVILTATIMFFFGGELFSIELKQFFFNLTMIHGYFGIQHVDGVYWSLLIELKFYLLIFILIIFNQIRFIKYYLSAWLVLAFYNYFYPLSGPLAFFFIPDWASYFIAGATFYLIRIEGPSIDKYSLIAFSFILSILKATKGIQAAIVHYHTDYSEIVLFCIISSFYLIFILISIGKTSFLNRQIFTSFGALTYPLYLIHQNIGFIFFNHFSGTDFKYITLILMCGISILSAYIINRQIEQKYSPAFKGFLINMSNKIPIPAKYIKSLLSHRLS